MPYILGTNDNDGSIFYSGMHREQWEFHSEYFPEWSELPATASHYETFIQADRAREFYKTKMGADARRLYIWEWHPA